MAALSLVALLCLTYWGSSALAQDLTPETDERYDLKIPVELVLVPVTVEDQHGKMLHGLLKEDFEVLEEGTVQKLTYFSAEPSPLSVAVLMDRTIDSRTQESFRENIRALLESFSSFDEMALYEYLETTTKIQGFSFNKDDLLESMRTLSFVPATMQGSTTLEYAPTVLVADLDSAIASAGFDLKRRGDDRRKVIFVFCNGVTSRIERINFEKTKKFLIENGIVVYGIGQGNSLLFRKVDPLRSYTEPTGGTVFYPWKNRAFSESYQKVSEAARNQYVLGYTPSAGFRDQGRTFKRIKVRIINERFNVGKVRHREGYFGFAP